MDIPHRGSTRPDVPLLRIVDFDGSEAAELPSIEDLKGGFRPVDVDVYAPHRHDYVELFIIRRGAATILVDEGERRIDSPTVCLVPTGSVHAWQREPHLDGIVMRVPERALGEAILRQLPSEPCITAVSGDLMRRIDALGGWLLADVDAMQARHVEVARAQLNLLFLELARLNRPLVARPSLQADRLLHGRFRDLVEQHYGDHWTVPEYAARLRVGRARLARAVRFVTGLTPAAIVHERLMSEACRLVRHTDLRLGVIADRLGFASQAHFSRYFRQAAGLPASDFRQGIEIDKKSSAFVNDDATVPA